jgi:DNA-binding NtrC family response regulator
MSDTTAPPARSSGADARQRRILVIDDDIYTHDLFAALFAKADPDHKIGAVEIIDAFDGDEGLERCLENNEDFDLILTDVRMSRVGGIEFLRRLRERDADTPVVMMTAYGSVETAVEAMKLGAFDYLTKPFDKPATIRHLVRRCFEHRDLRRENRALKARLEGIDAKEAIIGASDAMREVTRLLEKIAPIDSTVLITGASGTGKEMVARTLHRLSLRAERRFLPVNCGALPETLLESTLFGYEKGAFTGAHKTTPGYFEVADGGTLFLDEVEAMSPGLQVRLLRVLQERRFYRVGGTNAIETNVRVVSASKVDLRAAADEGQFRDDLFYRLNVLTVTLPPLKDRGDDIPTLARHFLARYNERFSKSIEGMSDEVLSALMGYDWPGNVRELENVIERAVALTEGTRLRLPELPPELQPHEDPERPEIDSGKVRAKEGPLVDFQSAKARFLEDYLRRLMTQAGGNISQAARLSGIPRQNLYGKLQQHGLDPETFRRS